MMRFFLLGILLAAAPWTRGETDYGDRYLGAYFLIQEADEAEKAGDWVSADAKYNGALKVLNEIRAEDANWQTTLMDFRIRFCQDRIADIQPKLPPPPPPVAPGGMAAGELPAPPSDTEQVRQLQAELQASRNEVKKLQQIRDDLSTKLDRKLQELAPTDRASAEQMLEQLRAMQLDNETISNKLELAKVKASRADALEVELRQSREKITQLEAERTGLNAKLQEALSAIAATGTTAQVESLLSKNAELTAQLATAQAEITKMRDEVVAGAGKGAAAESAEAVKLRAEIGQLQSELEQTKTLLATRTEELTMTRAELEKVRAENIRLTQSQEDLMARLNESDRQLRAAKASTDKDNEIIQQLQKENALLREITSKKSNEFKPVPKPKEPSGFLWFKPKPAPTNTVPATETSSVSKSEAGKLTAAVKAPTSPDAARAPAPAAQSKTSAPSPIAQSLLADARAAIVQGDFDTAAAKLQSALTVDPGDAAVLSTLGVVYYRQNRLDEAEGALRKAIAAAPNDSQARAVLGVVYYRKGKVEDAYGELTRAVALNPRNAEAHNYLGIVMAEKGWTTAAEQEATRAIELNPQYADAHFNLAVMYSRERTPRMELARYHYQKARDLGAPRDPQLEAALATTPAAKP